MHSTAPMHDFNDFKASFDDIYIADDPRDYFRVLGALDYVIPDLAAPVFRQVCEAWRAEHGRMPRVLDLGSSYGVNAALVRLPLSWDALRDRYARPVMMALPSHEVRRLDQAFFASWPLICDAPFIGLDQSEQAIAYALETGIMQGGIAADLESGSPRLSSKQESLLASADIIVSTGAIGYVTQRTFERLMDVRRVNAPKPWIASFVLRMFPFSPLAQAFEIMGLHTEKLDAAAFVQRRFRDRQEFASALQNLEAEGVSPEGFEADGLMYAEFFLSRPRASCVAAPLDQVVTVASGRSRRYGARFTRLETAEGETLTLVR